MKLVKCVIKLRGKTEYKMLIDHLLDIYMSHTAVFESPHTYTVTCHCNTIQAETNLDNVLEQLRAVTDFRVEKTPIGELPQARAVEMHGPPAMVDTPRGTFLVFPSMTGKAA